MTTTTHEPFGDVQHWTSPVIGLLRVECVRNRVVNNQYSFFINSLRGAIANAEGTPFTETYKWLTRKDNSADLTATFEPAFFAEDVKFWFGRAIEILQNSLDSGIELKEEDYIEAISCIYTGRKSCEKVMTRQEQEAFYAEAKDAERIYLNKW